MLVSREDSCRQGATRRESEKKWPRHFDAAWLDRSTPVEGSFYKSICPAEGLLSKTLDLYQLQVWVSKRHTACSCLSKGHWSPFVHLQHQNFALVKENSPPLMGCSFSSQLYFMIYFCHMGVFHINNPDQWTFKLGTTSLSTVAARIRTKWQCRVLCHVFFLITSSLPFIPL